MSETKLQVPEHVAIILDGNGRWAKKRLLPRKQDMLREARPLSRFVKMPGIWELSI